jgi:hypothetical protein
MPHGWNIFLTGDSILTNTATTICSSVFYKYLLLFYSRSAGNPEELEVHSYVILIWLVNIVLWHVKCVNQICLHVHLTELFSWHVTVHWLWTYPEICPSLYNLVLKWNTVTNLYSSVLITARIYNYVLVYICKTLLQPQFCNGRKQWTKL